MTRKSFKVALHAILTAVPTVLGYVLGPLTHTINLLLSFTGLPIGVRLGFMSLVIVVILARAILGRGAALVQGVLLAITGVIFHHGESPLVRIPKDFLLGLGVEIALLRLSRPKINVKQALVASILGGILSYIPYLMFIPSSVFHLALVASILLMPSFLTSCIIGGIIAMEILKRVHTVLKGLSLV